MIKILLYLSLLFASGIAAGEGVAPLDDSQLIQQLGFCDQGDSKKLIVTIKKIHLVWVLLR